MYILSTFNKFLWSIYIGTKVDLESAVLEVTACEGDKQILVKSSQKDVIVRYQ